MREVRDWLEQLGLAQYADSFTNSAIDADVLPELSDADLQELGVAALGHRKRLLKAIDALRSGDTTVPTSVRHGQHSAVAQRGVRECSSRT